MRRKVRLSENDLHRIIRESVNKILREMDDDFGTALDKNGREIHKGDVVMWYDPETGRKTKYEVYEEPTEDMVKLWSKYGECEAYPDECVVVG